MVTYSHLCDLSAMIAVTFSLDGVHLVPPRGHFLSQGDFLGVFWEVGSFDGKLDIGSENHLGSDNQVFRRVDEQTKRVV